MQKPRYTYTDVTHLVSEPTGKHVNVYISGTRVAEMWSDRLGNWYANCWIGDHYNTRGVRGGMTASQVVTYVESHIKRQHPEIREHNWSILLSLPTKLMGAITGWTPYEECSNCGQRRPRVVRGSAES